MALLSALGVLVAYLVYRGEYDEELDALSDAIDELTRRAVAWCDRYVPDTERRR